MNFRPVDFIVIILTFAVCANIFAVAYQFVNGGTIERPELLSDLISQMIAAILLYIGYSFKGKD